MAPPDVNVPPTRVLRGQAAFAFVLDVAVAVIDVPSWSDADVVAYLEEITTLGQRVPSRASISDFRGAMFGPHQRRIVVDWLAKEGLGAQTRACLLTSSALVRGAVTAYAWMSGTEGAAFDPKERERACAWVANGMRGSPAAVRHALEDCYRLVGHPLP